MVGAPTMTSQGLLPDFIGPTGPSWKTPARLARAALWTFACLLVLAASAWAQSTSFRVEDIRAALNESNRAAAASESGLATDPVAALANYTARLPAGHPPVRDREAHDSGYQPLLDYVEQLEAGRPMVIAAQPHGRADTRDDVYSNLREFAREIAPQPNIQLAAATKAVKAAPKVAVDAEATFVGSQVCMGCHASQASAFAQTLMGRIARTQKGKMECESCHGAGSLHVKLGGGRGAGGIISFRADDTSRTAEEHNAICLACHERGDRTYWRSSTHDTRGVACTNCHQVMRKVSVKHQLFKSTEVETCFQCHKLQRAQLQRSSHMPVREGKMTCSDCHNPHGSATDSLLKEVSLNDTCYKCHADKRGPFLWEHFPVRENCGNCHEPHGSNNEFLLKIAKPRLCYQCHTAAHGNPSNALAGTSFNRACTNCHSQIHGSNAPAGVLFQR